MINKVLGRYWGLPREIYVLFFARIINSIGAFVYPLMTLIMTNKLGMTSEKAGLITTIMLLTQLPSMLLGGKLADRFGRLKLLSFSQLLGAVMYLICGFLEMSDTVVILIIIASNCYAISYPALDAMTMDLTNRDNRKEAFSLLYMGLNIGYVLGPAIGGLLFENHLGLVFIGDGITTIASVILVLVFVKETLPAKDNGISDKLEKAKTGSVFKVLRERKIIIAVAAVLFLIQFSYAQMGFALPIHMDEAVSNSAANFGALVGFNGLLVIFATPLITYMIRKWKALYGTFAGALLYAAAFAMFIFAKSLLLFYAAMFILTMGEVIISVDAFAFISSMSPSSHRGRVNSVVGIIANAGRMVSPVIIGWIITVGGLGTGWLTTSLVALAAAGLLFMFMNSRGINKSMEAE